MTDHLVALGAARQLSLYAFLVAASRFVPIPFVDDLLPERLRRRMVQQLLRQAGRSYSAKKVAPIYADPGGCVAGCIGWAILLPFKLLLYPIRKILAVIGAAREVSQRMVTTFLLGRTVARVLDRGLLLEGTPDADLDQQAKRFRACFDRTLESTNTTIFGSPLEAALSSSRGLVRAGAKLGRRLSQRSEAEPGDPAEPADLPAADRSVIERVTGVVQSVLERPEVIAMIADFDARFDAAWSG